MSISCKGLLLLSAIVMAVADASAKRFVGFETDAFNRAFPGNYKYNIVFSPASFELDCAIVAESLTTIPKAKVSERLGVVIDFESTYAPMLSAMSERTNGFAIVTARGFCVSDLQKTSPYHTCFLQRVYGADVLPAFPRHGAQAWFRTTMEGEMEDFEISLDTANTDQYFFYDLVSTRIDWAQPFPRAATVKRSFHPYSSNPVDIEFMNDVRPADVWEAEVFTLVRLPMKNDTFFFCMMPRGDAKLGAIRNYMSSKSIDRLLITITSIADPAVSHGDFGISMPRLSMYSRHNLLPILNYFAVPVKGLEPVVGMDVSARGFFQHVRFELDECDHGKKGTPSAAAGKKTIVFDRPFLFFVYHEPTSTIPIAGQFTGLSR